MTKIRPDSPVVRETDAYERGDALVVSLHPKHLTIRLKGQRGEALALDYAHLLDIARDLDNLRRRLRKPPPVKRRAMRTKRVKDLAELQRIFNA